MLYYLKALALIWPLDLYTEFSMNLRVRKLTKKQIRLVVGSCDLSVGPKKLRTRLIENINQEVKFGYQKCIPGRPISRSLEIDLTLFCVFNFNCRSNSIQIRVKYLKSQCYYYSLPHGTNSVIPLAVWVCWISLCLWQLYACYLK